MSHFRTWSPSSVLLFKVSVKRAYAVSSMLIALPVSLWWVTGMATEEASSFDQNNVPSERNTFNFHVGYREPFSILSPMFPIETSIGTFCCLPSCTSKPFWKGTDFQGNEFALQRTIWFSLRKKKLLTRNKKKNAKERKCICSRSFTSKISFYLLQELNQLRGRLIMDKILTEWSKRVSRETWYMQWNSLLCL